MISDGHFKQKRYLIVSSNSLLFEDSVQWHRLCDAVWKNTVVHLCWCTCVHMYIHTVKRGCT